MLSLLAESIFAYIEELSADSVEGYAEARSRLEGERRHRRRELVSLLVRDPPAAEADLRAAAEAAGWRVPRTAAALACDEERLERLAGAAAHRRGHSRSGRHRLRDHPGP